MSLMWLLLELLLVVRRSNTRLLLLVLLLRGRHLLLLVIPIPLRRLSARWRSLHWLVVPRLLLWLLLLVSRVLVLLR